MTQSLLSIAVFLVLLASLPFLVKWVKQRSGGVVEGVGSQAKLVSVLSVGPHQRVVTVDVGPEGARQRLTLGVTPQSITCLHTGLVEAAPARIESPAQ
jgi:flagellar protein FliO/FliZ